MLTSKLEFGFINQCFLEPQMWAVNLIPVDPLAKRTVELVDEYRIEFAKYPNLETFFDFLTSKLAKSEIAYIQSMLTKDIDVEYTMKRVLEFIEEQRLSRGLFEADKYMKTGDVKAAKGAIIEGMQLFYNLPKSYKDAEESEADIETINFGYRTMDRPMGGENFYGAHRRNLVLVIAPRSTGKSLFMMNVGANVAEAGGTVVHITLEDSASQVRGRYGKRLGTKDIAGEIFIQEHETGSATVADFDATVNAYKPDLVIVDYINEVGVSENSKSGLSRELGMVARGLRAMAQRYNCVVLTAQQGPSAKKFSEEITTIDDGYWSKEPAHVADVGYTLNQTREMKDKGDIVVLLDKNRNGPDNIELNFRVDYDSMSLKEDTRVV